MNRRKAKVMRMGPSSLVVVIPKDWTRGMELQAGDEVEILYNGRLVVRPLRRSLEGNPRGGLNDGHEDAAVGNEGTISEGVE